MARTSERGGPQTRARISEVATRLFLDRGYDDVTVAEVAREAGVSTVTVFNHFRRKEDLFLDRAVDAVELLREAVRDRGMGVDAVTSLRCMSFHLLDTRHPLSGCNSRSLPFFRTVAGSVALIARAREITSELERTLADELEQDPTYEGPSALLAAFFIAGYRTAIVTTAQSLIDGEPTAGVLEAHRRRLEQLFDSLSSGLVSAKDTPAGDADGSWQF